METTLAVTLVIAGMIGFLIYDTYFSAHLEPVESTIDHHTYYVRELPDKQKAADNLATIRKNIETLIEHLKKTAPDDIRTKNLATNFNGDNMSEAPANNQYTSYTINKGEKVVVCLRSKENNSLVDINTMMFVMLHEMTHIATDSLGHTPEFWDNFKWVLHESINIGLYRAVDYAKKPQEYCGMKIESTPL